MAHGRSTRASDFNVAPGQALARWAAPTFPSADGIPSGSSGGRSAAPGPAVMNLLRQGFISWGASGRPGALVRASLAVALLVLPLAAGCLDSMFGEEGSVSGVLTRVVEINI